MVSWLQTFTGKKVHPLDPRPEDIDIVDIAHALSNCARFTGHSICFYSVGDHSVRASVAIENLPEVIELPGSARRRHALAALLHDGSESYLVDVPAPIKPHLKGYAEIERAVQSVIAVKFGLTMADFEHPLVKQIDRVMLATEKRDCMGPEPEPWPNLLEPLPGLILPRGPWLTKKLFLERFDELGGKR